MPRGNVIRVFALRNSAPLTSAMLPSRLREGFQYSSLSDPERPTIPEGEQVDRPHNWIRMLAGLAFCIELRMLRCPESRSTRRSDFGNGINNFASMEQSIG